MSVPAATPPAKTPGRESSGSLTLVCAVAAVLGVVGLAFTLAAQIGPRNGKDDAAIRAVGHTPAVQPLVAAEKTVTHDVIYELLGEEGARNVTYVAQGAAIAQEREAATPWSKSFQRTGVEGGDQFYSVSAQSGGTGTLRCRIIIDGRMVSENSTTGDRAMVTCVR
jgi:hypothetical protein